MQREIFLKFIDKMQDHCETVLIGSDVDYRRLIAHKFVHEVRTVTNISLKKVCL